MSSTTTKLGLIKPADNEYPDIKDAVNDNMDKLDSEVWSRGKTFNGETVGADGGFHVNYIPYAGNLETSSSQKSDDDYIIRTTGGEASLEDGDAWLLILRGRMRHDNYTPQSIDMTVVPMERTPDPDITATLNEATFEAYVGEAGTYTLTYTTEWSANPSDYGLSISNTPIAGDTIIITWDGENDAEVTINAATRPTPESITATIDEEVFVTYVTQSGTTTLTYSTAWSADPTNYGITVTGTPVAGDVITVVYVKEVRGTIVQSNPETFVSTGWNLYNHALGYARLIKYSSESGYGFKISGTYTALEFSTTTTGSRTTITPVSGYFTIPSDGYLFVTGGNATDTQIWMTWSDWTSTANGGTFEAYTQDVIDMSTFMASTFPYGLMAVGDAYDEINLNVGVATSNVTRMAYNATNLANAEASGLQYEYDENYIYIERTSPVTYLVEIDGAFKAYDHGMEYFTGSEQAVYAQTLYGANLKNKLERDVVTISQQTLTSAQKNQVCNNLGIGTLRYVPFALAVSDWTSITGGFKATYDTAYVTSTCKWEVLYDSSLKTYASRDFIADIKSGAGGIEFVTAVKPTGTISGEIKIIDNADGRLSVVPQETVASIVNGGTGQSSLEGIKEAFGINALNSNKTKYIEVNATENNRYDLAGASAAYALIPNQFFGTCKINFKDGWRAMAIVNKATATYGNMLYVTDGDKQPYFYSITNGTQNFQQVVLNNKLGYIDVDMSGVAVTTADAGWYYGEKSIASSLPSNSRAIGIAEGASFDANVFYQVTTADTIRVKSSTSKTLGNGRSVRVFYCKD